MSLIRMKYIKFIFFFIIFDISLNAQGLNIDTKIQPESAPTSNCDFCLCSMGVSPLDFSGKGIRIDPRYLFINKIVKDGKDIENTDGSYEKHFTIQFSGIYPITRKFSVIGIIPYSMRDGQASSGEPALHTSGIGDVSIMGRYNLMEKHTDNYCTFMLAFQGGIKFPTGKSDERDASNSLIDPHLQVGTGSTDFLIGTNFLFSKERLSLSTNLLYGIKTTGKTGYRFGNNLNYDASIRYLIFQTGIGKNMFLLNAGIYGEQKAHDLQDGIKIGDSGGNTLYITGGFDFFVSPYFAFSVQYKKPVLYHLNGIQDGETFGLTSGIQFIFY